LVQAVVAEAFFQVIVTLALNTVIRGAFGAVLFMPRKTRHADSGVGSVLLLKVSRLANVAHGGLGAFQTSIT